MSTTNKEKERNNSKFHLLSSYCRWLTLAVFFALADGYDVMVETMSKSDLCGGITR